MPPAPNPDRRRDPRHRVAGHAFLRGVEHQEEVFGGIVDVSAGGVRLRVRRGHGVAPGDVLALDVEVSLPQVPPSSPPVRLKGQGAVVWCSDPHGGASEVALRFSEPLVVCEAFALPSAAPA